MKSLIFKTLDMFVRTNIIIVTLYILRSKGSWTELPYYPIILGILGIFWIIIPILDYFLEDKQKVQDK